MKTRFVLQRSPLAGLILSTLLLLISLTTGCERRKSFKVAAMANPATPGSICPNETHTPDGNVVLSWLEPTGDSLALRFATQRGHSWSEAQTVVVRKNFDKYPEAPPWVLSLPNKSLVAVWAEQLPKGTGKWPGNYLLAATSSNAGKNWSQPAIVHSDRTDGEHSFASLAAQDDSHAVIVWLDSRDYEAKHTYRLMSAVIASSGSVSEEITVDDDVCTCCPTALINTPQGLMAAYRNHTSQEIRDIYTVRQQSGKWQNGQPLHNDGWHINGCPVNGPALSRNENEVVAAWFTGTEDRASVNAAFSSDGGISFKSFVPLDSAEENKSVLGRVAVTLPDSENAFVSWIRRKGERSQLVIAHVRPDATVLHSEVIAEGSSDSLGYPRMQLNGSEVLLSWGGTGEAKQVNTALVSRWGGGM